MFVSVRTKSGSRSLELERKARAKFGVLFRDGKIPLHICNWVTARDGKNILRAVAWINTSEAEGVMAETAMRHYQMGDWVQFAVRGIVMKQLLDEVESALDGTQNPQPMVAINEHVEAFKNRYETIMAFGVT